MRANVKMRLLVVTAAATMLTGCVIHGKWALQSVDPTAARRDFDYQSITLQRDGSYYAESLEMAGNIETTSGTYTFEDGKLTLVAHDGEKHTYDAELRSADKLTLERPWKDRVAKATLIWKR